MTSRLRVSYVVGSSHSGSTLVAFLADQHPAIASVGETAVKRGIRWEGRTGEQQCSCGQVIDACPFWQRIFADVSAAGSPFSSARWRTDYRFEQPVLDWLLTRETSSTALRRVRGWAMRQLPPLRSRNSRVDRTNLAFIRAVLERRGAAVFFDTTKLLTRLSYLLDIPELDVRVVWLARDARGFAASAKRRGGSAVAAATVWRNDQTAIERFLASRPGLPTLLVRYEDLCEQPETALRRLWTFCGVQDVAPATDIEADRHHVLGNNMRMRRTIQVRLDETWRARLGREDEQLVLEVAGGANDRLGYARA